MSEATERIVIPYSPRYHQAEVHAALDQHRFGVLVAHRRFGKTVLAVNQLIKKVLTCKMPDPRCHYVGPTYGQTKRIAWKYVHEFSRVIPEVQFNESELRAIYPNGGEIHLLGAENYNSHRGIYSDYAVFDEPALQPPGVFGEVFRPALADRKGGALWIGTPAGHNSFWDRWQYAGKGVKDWYRRMLKVTETGALPIDEIKAMRAEMTKAEFEQELLCSFEAAVRGSYYADAMAFLDANDRITDVPWDPNFPCIVALDLGLDDQTVATIWQRTTAEHRMIDTKVWRNVGFDKILKELLGLPYHIGQWIGPHDLRVREYTNATSRIDFADNMGVEFEIAPNISIEDGIQAVRTLLPKCVIDRSKCFASTEALRIYRADYDERKGVFRSKPFHGPESDFADSIRYYAVTDTNSQTSLWSTPMDYSAQNKAVI